MDVRYDPAFVEFISEVPIMIDAMIKRLSSIDNLADALERQELVKRDRKLSKRLAEAAIVKGYPADTDLIVEGNVGQEYLYFILSGKVDVLVGNQMIRQNVTNEAFGEFPILEPGKKHDVTVRAQEDTVAALVHERNLKAIGVE
jgi:CRP-like cAMP-binding protein